MCHALLVSLKISIRGHVSVGIHRSACARSGSTTYWSSVRSLSRCREGGADAKRIVFQWGCLNSEVSQRFFFFPSSCLRSHENVMLFILFLRKKQQGATSVYQSFNLESAASCLCADLNILAINDLLHRQKSCFTDAPTALRDDS